MLRTRIRSWSKEPFPFGLKTIESLLAEAPNHKGLLYAAVSGFHSVRLRLRAAEGGFHPKTRTTSAPSTNATGPSVSIYARFGYGMRALEEEFDDFETRLRRDPEEVLGTR